MNSFKRVIEELDRKKGEIDIVGAEKQAWLETRCTKALIVDLSAMYLDALNELPSLSTATSEGREESDKLKGKIELLESILNDVTEIPEDDE